MWESFCKFALWRILPFVMDKSRVSGFRRAKQPKPVAARKPFA